MNKRERATEMKEMKRIEGTNKKWMPLLWLIAAAVMAELVLCNLSAWKSLFYRERVVYDNMSIEGGMETEPGLREYIVGEGVLTIHIPEVNQEVHNLFFAMDFSENDAISYTVTLTDEGNYYPYSLPERVLVPQIRKSFYTNVYPSGKVGEITVQFVVPAGSVVAVNGIGANARIPFVFSAGRFLVILAVLGLIYCGGNRRIREMVCEGTKMQRLVTAFIILLLMGAAWKLAHVNPICITSPWPHHKQYQEVAEAMAEGHLYLDMEPSEGLLNVENPYDTIYLQANGILVWCRNCCCICPVFLLRDTICPIIWRCFCFTAVLFWRSLLFTGK